jgi:hypothetical protein
LTFKSCDCWGDRPANKKVQLANQARYFNQRQLGWVSVFLDDFFGVFLRKQMEFTSNYIGFVTESPAVEVHENGIQVNSDREALVKMTCPTELTAEPSRADLSAFRRLCNRSILRIRSGPHLFWGRPIMNPVVA